MNIIESIVVTEDVTLISLQDCPNDITFLAQLFEIISNADVNVDMISQTPAKGGLIDISFTVSSEQLAEVLKTLTPREARVLSLRYGLEDGNPKTLEEVGKEFNVTRERIRQIEAKALRKLRHPSRSKKLRDFLD